MPFLSRLGWTGPMRNSWIVLVLFGGAALAGSTAGCAAEPRPEIATAGGGTVAASPSADRHEQALRLAACLREQGLDVPDPAPNANPKFDVVPDGIPKQRLAAAMEKCRRYAPELAAGKSLAAEDLERLRRYARCMREQGFPDWPDPDPNTGATKWDDPERALAAKNDPKFRPALAACRQYDVFASPHPK